MNCLVDVVKPGDNAVVCQLYIITKLGKMFKFVKFRPGLFPICDVQQSYLSLRKNIANTKLRSQY